MIVILYIVPIVLYGMYLIVDYKNPYVDIIHEEGEILRDEDIVGTWYVYKREYKNGKVKFVHKNVYLNK